ncbi:unnamed protein product [Effrenium voratum]|nr:unnamed protein product [Effrenium voratum]
MAIPKAADLQALAATNQAQADNIVAAGTADKRPGCRKDIVENLLEVFEEALEFTGRLGAERPWEVLTAKGRENLSRYTKQFGDSRGTGFNLT